MTQKEYAEHRGVSPPRITTLKKQGALAGCFKKISGKKLIDRDKADAKLKGGLDQKFNRPGSRPGGKESKNRLIPEDAEEKTTKAGTGQLSLADAQRIQAQYKAALMKLEYEEKSGELVKVSKVEADFFNIARMVRDSILNIPDRISAELASTTDTHVVSEKLTTELVAALEELSNAS